jgi:ribose transport system ATP-binding protein
MHASRISADVHEVAGQEGAGVALLQLEGVSKRFPGVDALSAVDFDLQAGEVHVLFGENGAGKSTLISIVAGVQKPTAGRILLRGETVELRSVYEARQRGISAVFQELSLVPQLTVEDNLFLGAEIERGFFLDKARLHRRALEIIARLKFPLKPTDRVAYLSRAEQQMVEIAKAFRTEPAILIFDEPTASLTEREVDHLFEVIGKARKAGVGVIYITHRMSEIKRIGDRITVLRDGRKIATLPVECVSERKLVSLMTGRVIEQIYPTIAFRPGRTLLDVRGLTTADGSVRNASIRVRAGEIVGIAGLVGSGKSQVGRACFGAQRIAGGSVTLDGADVTGLPIRQIIRRGLFYVPSDRRQEGLVMVCGARENMALPSLDRPVFASRMFLKRKSELQRTRELAKKVELRPNNLERHLQHFSGGNQQKVLIAKALTREIKLFIFDEPTVGIDVGARLAIYGFIKELCEAGAGVLLISSDLPEILHLTHRTYVMYRGELRAELHGADITQENVLSHFFERETA